MEEPNSSVYPHFGDSPQSSQYLQTVRVYGHSSFTFHVLAGDWKLGERKLTLFWVAMMVWIRIAFIGSYVLILGPELVGLFEKD